MAKLREEMAKKLRCNKVEGLPGEFIKAADSLAVKYYLAYSEKEGPYMLSVDIIKNRIENIMYSQLQREPQLTARKFLNEIRLPEIFIDADAIQYLVELAGSDNSDEYFLLVCHFFSHLVKEYISHHAFYLQGVDKCELTYELYKQVYIALKKCAQKNCMFNFNTLQRMFQAAAFELNGIEKFPFGISRRNIDQYFRFRAIVMDKKYLKEDMGKVAEEMSLSLPKVLSYWELLVMERKGFISTSMLLDDETGETEWMYGSTVESGYYDSELYSIRNSLFYTDEDKRIFDWLVSSGSGVFSKELIEELGTTRYRINCVKQKLEKYYTDFKPIK